MAASTAASTLVANLASSRSSSLAGSPLSSSSSSSSSCARSASKAAFAPLTCKCEKAESVDSVTTPPVAVHRRLALALLAGAAAIGSRTSPAQAVYGESANVFGAAKKDTGFMPVVKDGFKLEIPAKWNPSKEVEYPGTVLRYEDNFDAISNIAVMVTPTSKSSIKDYGSPEEFLNSVSFLLGKQAFAGKTQSEGGFEANAVATAAVLETSTPVVNGKDYYNISVLTRTADGGEGGKHQIIVATVNAGKLYLLKAQAGDKRWFKGTKKLIEGAANSFNIA